MWFGGKAASSTSAHSGEPRLVNTTPGEAASPRVLPCWVWQLEDSGVEGPILSKQTVSPVALVFCALGCSPQGVDVVL